MANQYSFKIKNQAQVECPSKGENSTCYVMVCGLLSSLQGGVQLLHENSQHPDLSNYTSFQLLKENLHFL